MILHDLKLIFVHIPRCGGTSIETAFTGADLAHSDPGEKHITARKATQRYGAHVWSEYATWSVVRNPWARLLSFYNLIRMVETMPPFDDWIRDVCSPEGLHFRGLAIHWSLMDYLGSDDGTLMVDSVGRFENLEDDFATFGQSVGAPDLRLPKLMVGHYDRDYRSWYSPSLRRTVEQRFGQDIEQFQYQF